MKFKEILLKIIPILPNPMVDFIFNKLNVNANQKAGPEHIA
jgi:hypothetical protein